MLVLMVLNVSAPAAGDNDVDDEAWF